MKAEVNEVQRQPGLITLYLSPGQPAPMTIPGELQGYISPDEWAVRIPAVIKLGSQYSKPNFERIWTCLGIVSIIALPIGLYNIVVNKIQSKEDFSTASFFEARIASLAIFVVALLLFLVPIAIWKFIGRRRMSALLNTWAQEDNRRNLGAFIPVWRVKTPTIFSGRLVLLITTPPNSPPSLFHPGAYMPSFIANTRVPPFRNYSSSQNTIAENGDEHVLEFSTEKGGSTESVNNPFHDRKAENPFEDFVEIEHLV